MRCWGGTDTGLLYRARGQMKNLYAVRLLGYQLEAFNCSFHPSRWSDGWIYTFWHTYLKESWFLDWRILIALIWSQVTNAAFFIWILYQRNVYRGQRTCGCWFWVRGLTFIQRVLLLLRSKEIESERVCVSVCVERERNRLPAGVSLSKLEKRIPRTAFQWHYNVYIQYSVTFCVLLPVRFISVTTKHRRNSSQLIDQSTDEVSCKLAIM